MSAHSPVAPDISGRRYLLTISLSVYSLNPLNCRTCCFNYLRKRTDPSVKPAAPSADTTNDLDGTTFAMSTKPADRPVNAHETHLLAELNSFKDEQKARTQSFMAQLQRFFFGQISAFLYVQLLESRRFYDMLQAADGHPLRSVGVAAAGLSSPRET